MSVQKLEVVQKSRKDQGKCSRCGDALPAGSPYQYWYPGFRSNYKIVRCMKAECTPRPSERETSKAATILAAQEAFGDNLHELESIEDIEAAVQEVAEAVGEVRDEYQEALDAWPSGNEQIQEKVDTYESAASEIESWSWDGATEPEPCELHDSEEHDSQVYEGCEFCTANRENWLEEIRDAAREAVDAIEMA